MARRTIRGGSCSGSSGMRRSRCERVRHQTTPVSYTSKSTPRTKGTKPLRGGFDTGFDPLGTLLEKVSTPNDTGFVPLGGNAGV